jgi:hypothetical protein
MMTTKTILLSTCVLISTVAFSQKNKVQSAWRALSDYESTLNDKPDTTYLMKANRNIDLALADESTKNQAKTHAYKARIMYYVYQYNLKEENKKLEGTISDKNARAEAAYGNAGTKEFELAGNSLEMIKAVDPKYFSSILEIVKGGSGSSASDDDLKLSSVAMQLKLESSNIAVGKYKLKLYEQAADFFYKSGTLNLLLAEKIDTSAFYNACISAQKSKNPLKMIEYNKKMIDMNIATPYNYQTIYDAKLAAGDNAGAQEYLAKGRKAFPNDVYLMNKETELFLQKGDQQKALENLQAAISKDPNNAQLHLVLGNVYDNLANPKMVSGKDSTKPANYDELVMKAADHYQKSVDLRPSNQDSYFNALYNLGALYNNYGATLYNKAMEKATITQLSKTQKDIEAKSKEYYKKAIPFLEQALSVRSDDRASMVALRKLYLLVGDEQKAKEMGEKLK